MMSKISSVDDGLEWRTQLNRGSWHPCGEGAATRGEGLQLVPADPGYHFRLVLGKLVPGTLIPGVEQ